MFAYVQNGVVRETCRNESPFNVFFPEYAALFVPCPDTVEQGDLYDGENWTKPTASVAELRASLIAQIKQIRDTKTQTGGFPAAGKWFHSDTLSRTQQLGLVLMGPSVPDGLSWKTMDGSFITMTPTLASQVFAAAASQDAALFAHAEALIAQVNAAADPSTIDITTGWPDTFAD